MPKQQRRRSSKEAVAGISNDGSRLERKQCGKSTEVCNELQSETATAQSQRKAAHRSPPSGAPPSAPTVRTEVLRVPQVTITPEGCGASREMQQGDWDEVVEGPLRRKLSNSSISSTGSSVGESEDDILSDSESKGIITLEHLGGVESGEVSQAVLLTEFTSPNIGILKSLYAGNSLLLKIQLPLMHKKCISSQ